MKINRRVSLRFLRALLATLVLATAPPAGRATAQTAAEEAPKSTAEKAIGSHTLRAKYNAKGDPAIGVALFEVVGIPQIFHKYLPKPAENMVEPRAISGSMTEHATGVLGVLTANTLRGLYTGGTARGYKIYLYTREDVDARGYFTQYYAERGAGKPNWNISNHSYGSTDIAGWRHEQDPRDGAPIGSKVWIWYGHRGTYARYGMAKGDTKFGWYSPGARDLDSFIVNHPTQIPVYSVGNHTDEGPLPGDVLFYVRRDPAGTWRRFPLTDSLPPKNGRANGLAGFDCIEGIKTAKNVITVGSVTPALNPSGWVRSKFSSTGPTDDGRVKPDVMAYGGYALDVVKPVGSAIDSGTSYAAPAVAGVLAQLAQIWKRSNPSPMLAATARVLLCHTAKDLGTPGPDYEYGWGLVDGAAAGALLEKRKLDGAFALQERTLKNNRIDTIYIKAPKNAKVKVTIAWTDPAGEPRPLLPGGVPPLDDRTSMLRNDLDMSVYKITGAEDQTTSTEYRPWRLDPEKPGTGAAPAPVGGTNRIDNIEQVALTVPASFPANTNGVYMIVVRHKGTLRMADGTPSATASQPYSIAISNASEHLPIPRSIVAVQMGSTDARVTWKGVASATHYDIQYRSVGTVTWKSKAASVTPHADFLAMATGSYQMRVRTRRNTVPGTWSAPVAFFIGTPPGVTGMNVTNTTTSSAQLNWTAIPGVTGYTVAWAVVDHEGTLVWDDFRYQYTTANKYTIKNMPADELFIWYVNAHVAPSAESGFVEAEMDYIPGNCASYEPGNNTTNGARVMRVNENFTGLICSSEEVDWFRIDPRDNIDDRYMQFYLVKHPMPYTLRLWRKVKGQGGTLSAVANISRVFSPTDDQVLKYNSIDFHYYEYYVEIKTPVKGSIYDDYNTYSFWAETRNNAPWGTGRGGNDDPSMSMQHRTGGSAAVHTGMIEQR